MVQRPLSLGVATRRVLADEVTDDLRDAIVSHELEPGRKLTEDELAAQLGVSRGPVREALMRLEREGLVVIERHRGATIASWNRQDIEEIYSLRGALEELAIEWATAKIRVNAIQPCSVNTPGWRRWVETEGEKARVLMTRLLEGIPLGRVAEPEDIADAVHFLASDSAAMITGTILPVDGGNLAFNAGGNLGHY